MDKYKLRIYVYYDDEIAEDSEDDTYDINDFLDYLICDLPEYEYITPVHTGYESLSDHEELILSCDLMLIFDLFCKSNHMNYDEKYALDAGIPIIHMPKI